MSDRNTPQSSDAELPAAGQRPGRVGSQIAKARRRRRAASLLDPAIMSRAVGASFKKLDPRVQAKNPVMFVVEIGSVVTSIEFVRTLLDPALAGDQLFVFGVAI